MVEGAAMAKKHQRTSGKRSASGSQLQQGGIIDTELFIDISNVMLVCPVCNLPTRVGIKVKEIKGETVRVRVCKRDGCGQEVDK